MERVGIVKNNICSIQFKILDLFSGAGGFSLGLDQVEGFETVIATDFNEKAKLTYEYNFPNTEFILGDITNDEIKEKIVQSAKEKGVNMVIGGPPCQGFSLKGKKLGLDDPRNFLFLEYVDIVSKIKPDIFIIENVKAMVTTSEGYFMRQIYEKFESLGYKLNHGILNAVEFGVPQTRERAFVIGTTGSEVISLPIGNKNKIVTVKDAISDLSYLNSGEGEKVSNYKTEAESNYQNLMRKNSKLLFNHNATRHSDLAIKKLSYIPPEGDKSSLPEEYIGKQKFGTTWSRLIWDKPSPTIDTRFDTPSNGRNSHPYLNRSITPREAARIQSFPDNFKFLGNKTSICTQIGNAVPPLLAKAIGEHIIQEKRNGK